MKKTSLLLLAGISFLLSNAPAQAALLTSFGFDQITSASISTTQYQTGNRLVYNAVFADWNKSGFNATHAIQLSGAVHGGAGDYAIMIYGNNVLLQQTPFAANDNLAAFRHRISNMAFDFFNRFHRNQRALLDIGLDPMANFKFRHALGELFNKRIINAVLRVNAVRADTSLSHIAIF